MKFKNVTSILMVNNKLTEPNIALLIDKGGCMVYARNKVVLIKRKCRGGKVSD